MLARDAAARTARRRRYGRRTGRFLGGMPSPVTFPTSPLTMRVHIALGADLTASHLSWNWLDVTQWVRFDLGVTLTVGRRDEAARVNPSRAQLKLDNRDGRFVRRNPAGPYFGLLSRNTPIWIELNPGSGFVDRYHGYINEWPTRWADQSGNDSFVTITCAGVMRRLAQGENLKSAMFRSISGLTPGSIVPIAYWPLEDGSQATQFASATNGLGPVIPVGEISYSADSELAGSAALPTFATGAQALFSPAPYESVGAWMVQLAVKAPTTVGSDTVIATITTDGSGAIARYDIELSPTGFDSLNLNGYDSAGALQVSGVILLDGSGPANPTAADFYGNWWSIRVVEKIGDVGIIGYIFLSGTGSEDVAQSASGAVGNHSTIRSVKLIAAAATDGIAFGHLGIHADASLVPAGAVTQDIISTVGALSGWSGEQAHNRVKRLCREEGISARALAGTSAAMGPQGRGTLLDALRDCEVADGGILYEYQFGFGYQALSERYNQPVALALDFAAKHIIMPMPADDDQRLRNEWTVSRSGGSFATYRDDSDVAANGVYDDQATVNVETDAQLADVAAWKVHIGTVDEDRWPALPLKLHGSPDLIPAWLATPLGARMTVDNPPDGMPPDQIDLIIEGWTERWDSVTWDVSLSTSPASPYRVAVLDDASLGKIDSGSSSLTADILDSATSFDVTTTDPLDLWTTDAAQLPITLRVGGEDMTIPAGTGSIAGASSPQTFSGVVRSVNGVVKAHLAGTEVHVKDPARLAL